METSVLLSALALIVSIVAIILSWRATSRQNELAAAQTRLQGELVRIEGARHEQEQLSRSRASLTADLWRTAHEGTLDVTNHGAEARKVRITVDGQPLAEHLHFKSGFHSVGTIGPGVTVSFHMLTFDGMDTVFKVALQWEDASGIPGEWKSDLTLRWV
jgi:hypothetical protein